MALPKLIVILGTTACGKSGLGVELAKHVGGEIVSAEGLSALLGISAVETDGVLTISTK